MKEYKVLAQSDSIWKDRFSPTTLQATLNEHARSGWRVVACTTSEFTGLGGLGTKRHELFVLLERDVSDDAERQVPLSSDGRPYDPSLIPKDRFYRDIGNVSTMLQSKGLVSKEQMTTAREEFAQRGGHLCDHLLALGYIDLESLRTALGKGA